MKNKAEIKTSIAGLAVNLLLAISKILAGILSGSNTILADGINSLSDSLNSLITIFSYFYSGRPADDEHPYGHERMEAIGGFLVVIIMAYLGIDLLRRSIMLVFNPSEIEVSPLIIAIMVMAILLKIGLTIFYHFQNKKLKSGLLQANAMDAFFDIFMSLVVLIAVVLENRFGWKLDAYLSLVLSIIIIVSALKMMRSFVNDLLGNRPAEALLQKIHELLSEERRILGYHDLLVHQYGKHRIYASVDVELDERLSLTEAHNIIDSIETALLEQQNVNLSIHLDPVNLEDLKLLEVEALITNYLKDHYPAVHFHDLRRLNGHGFRFDMVLDGGDQELLSTIHLELEDLLKENHLDSYLEIVLDDHQLLP